MNPEMKNHTKTGELSITSWWVFPWWFSSHGMQSIRSKSHEINNIQASIWKKMWGNKTTHKHPCFFKKSIRPKTHQIKISSFPHSPSQENHTILSSFLFLLARPRVLCISRWRFLVGGRKTPAEVPSLAGEGVDKNITKSPSEYEEMR